MSTAVMDLCRTFNFEKPIPGSFPGTEYPHITKARRLLLANQIAVMDGITIEEAHRQIHEQLRIW